MFENRSLRLKGYDYTRPGDYFVTIVAKNRYSLFTKIVYQSVALNEYGKIVQKKWNWLAKQYDYVSLSACIVMPSHLHGIIENQ